MPEVSTPRMDLVRFVASDLDELAILFAKPQIWHYPYGRGFSREETEAFLERQIADWEEFGVACWLARAKSNGQVVGYVGLSVPTFLPEILPALEVGWRFDPAVWGQGMATEGARAALQEGFETLKLEEICSIPQTDNPRSWMVCERLGMRRSRDVCLPATDRRDEVGAYIYTIQAPDWDG